MKEEDIKLKEKFGTENHFTVPEDYFKNLVPNIMEQLPEMEKKETPPVRLWDKVKPWIYMAAMFCGLLFTIRQVVSNDGSVTSTTVFAEEQYSDIPDEYIDPIIDQMMVDDYTLYMYLSDAEGSIY